MRSVGTVSKNLGILCVYVEGWGGGAWIQAHHQIQDKSPLLTREEDAPGGREDFYSVHATVITTLKNDPTTSIFKRKISE